MKPSRHIDAALAKMDRLLDPPPPPQDGNDTPFLPYCDEPLVITCWRCHDIEELRQRTGLCRGCTLWLAEVSDFDPLETARDKRRERINAGSRYAGRGSWQAHSTSRGETVTWEAMDPSDFAEEWRAMAGPFPPSAWGERSRRIEGARLAAGLLDELGRHAGEFWRAPGGWDWSDPAFRRYLTEWAGYQDWTVGDIRTGAPATRVNVPARQPLSHPSWQASYLVMTPTAVGVIESIGATPKAACLRALRMLELLIAPRPTFRPSGTPVNWSEFTVWRAAEWETILTPDPGSVAVRQAAELIIGDQAASHARPSPSWSTLGGLLGGRLLFHGDPTRTPRPAAFAITPLDSGWDSTRLPVDEDNWGAWGSSRSFSFRQVVSSRPMTT